MTNRGELAMSVAEDPGYGGLKQYLIAHTGMAYFDDRDQALGELIGRRLMELGLRHCSSYSELLEDGAAGRAELDNLVAELTIGETYFFRDREQFEAIREIVLPEILERKRSSKELRIWSAGCSNGAEPYSLAILLERELGRRLAGWEVRILATDINQRFLAEAGEGKFGEWAFRSTPEEVKRRCFASDGRLWTIHPEYKRWISFQRMNLVEDAFPSWQSDTADFDLILCRNVMIYFSLETTRRLIAQFHASLGSGGWFLVGPTEPNLDNFTAFRQVNAAGTTLYQKIGRIPPAGAAPAGETTPLPLPPPPREFIPTPAATPAPAARLTMDGLRTLADRGDWEGAIRYCRTLLASDGLNPAVHFYHGLVLEQMGLPAEAERSLRQAIYLDRNFAMAHYQLGLTLQRGKNPRQANRCFENVLELLSGMRDEEPLGDGDGVTVGGLKKLARTHLAQGGRT